VRKLREHPTRSVTSRGDELDEIVAPVSKDGLGGLDIVAWVREFELAFSRREIVLGSSAIFRMRGSLG
jgi:hypothetical protein